MQCLRHLHETVDVEYNWLISTVNIMDSDEVETVQSSQGSCTLISFVNICTDDVTESENSDVEALVEHVKM